MLRHGTGLWLYSISGHEYNGNIIILTQTLLEARLIQMMTNDVCYQNKSTQMLIGCQSCKATVKSYSTKEQATEHLYTQDQWVGRRAYS